MKQWNKFLQSEAVSDEQYKEFKEFYKKLKQKSKKTNIKGFDISTRLTEWARKNFDAEDYISQGWDKIVYQFDDKTVLKIGSKHSFEPMIKVFQSEYSSLIPEILESGHYWVLEEKVEVIRDPEHYYKIFPGISNALDTFLPKLESNDKTNLIIVFMQTQDGSMIHRTFELDGYEYGLNNKLYSRWEKSSDEAQIMSLITDKVYEAIMNNLSPFAQQLLKANRELGIPLTDLHEGNVGITYSDKRPVVIDF